ncbi:hypothetical protein ABMA27_010061 [Loxostege sticticalis]|uniref:Protein lingerer n=1 Tax=Loxostege sticticalis TaxID=481309 RepID=A0ABR3H7E7_LOXSC
MSLGARATKGGAKAGKEGKHAPEKGKGTDKPQPKEKVKPQATTEQLRMAHMIDRKSEDASDVRRMVLELMEMTRRTEEEVCSALHDSDNDMVAACNLLLEESQRIQGEWQTSEKKKKKPPAAGNGEVETRARPPNRPRRGEGEGGRGGGAAGAGGAPSVRGRGGFGARGGGAGGRGGRGARGARRGAPGRPQRPHRLDHDWPDTNLTGNNMGDPFPTTEDWDNEEWSGSLSDTKVFTPSASAAAASEPEPQPQANQEDWDTPEANGPTESHIPTYTYHNPHHHHSLIDAAGAASTGSPGARASPARSTPPAPADAYHHHQQPMGMSGSLSAAQSQYLSQLTQQSQRHDNSVYTAAYGVYGENMAAQRKPQRARVPPPSKIPMSAVEMPGGGEAGAAMFLDVQFGALEPDALDSQVLRVCSVYMSLARCCRSPCRRWRCRAAARRARRCSWTCSSARSSPTRSTRRYFACAAYICRSHAVVDPHVGGGDAGRRRGGRGAVPGRAQVTSQAETQPVSSSHETTTEAPSTTYPNSNSMLNETLSSVVETTPTTQPPVTTESPVTNTTSSVEKQLSASMKQLAVSASDAAAPHAHLPHHRPKNVYAHHAVSHHPPVYGANVYAPQVNSTNASLTGASAMAASAYPSSVTLTQYQPMINSYQQTSSSAAAYGGSALYTAAAPYAYAHTHAHAPHTHAPHTPPAKQPHKDHAQYDSSVASNNSLASTSTTQTSTAKVATTTAHAAASAAASAHAHGAAPSAGAAPAASSAPSAQSNAANIAGAGYAAAALYGAAGVGGVGGVGGVSGVGGVGGVGGATGAYAAYDEQLMRSTSTLPHHMGGYYEVNYGSREGTFGLGAGERFGRTDAASPQQVPAALPPGYAYFYQPPPTTYQYGVYPTYGGGSSVGGVGGVGGAGGKVSTYTQQQAPYDAQDSYKPGGPYSGGASKAQGTAADLSNAMYKTHVALNKVNSYDKATFHSGTPPPFGAGSHLYIPAPPHHPHHHHHSAHAQQHQESGAGGGRGAASKPPASKPTYSQSYWTPN